jgi:hypothetical protein
MTRPQLTRASAGTMILGSLCPWASLLGVASVIGIQTWLGWVTLLAGAAILTLQLEPRWLTQRLPIVHRRRRRVSRTLAVLSALLCLLVVIGVGDSQYGAALHPSWGLYLTLLAALSAAWTLRKTGAGV